MCSYYANAFNSTKGSSVVQADIMAEKLPQNVFWEQRKQFKAGGTQTRVQQIKYYWGWCHRHKNAWKLAEHVSKIVSRFPVTAEDVQQFLCWRLIFPEPFQFSLPATLPLSLPSTRCAKENRNENRVFCRILLQYRCAPKTDQTFCVQCRE